MYFYINVGETPGDYHELGYGGTEGIGVSRNGSLVIPRVLREHGGFYLCQGSNGIGPGLSKLIRLTVHGKIFNNLYTVCHWHFQICMKKIRLYLDTIVYIVLGKSTTKSLENFNSKKKKNSTILILY